MSVRLENVSYSYRTAIGQIIALDDVSLSIVDGECAGIIGETGSGKTTLLHVIAGLKRPQQGRVIYDGRDMKGLSERDIRRRIGIVFQYPQYQLFETTVERDVAFSLRHSKMSEDEKHERVKRALEAMGFEYERIAGKSPHSLSGGERRRVAIAGVLVSKPSLLIFDEPSAGLDPQARWELTELVKKLNKGGTTVLIVSHNADFLAGLCNRLIIMENARVRADGPIEKIYRLIECEGEKSLEALSSYRRIAKFMSDRGLMESRNIINEEDFVNAVCASAKLGSVSHSLPKQTESEEGSCTCNMK